jgi:hypothetical protein
MYNYSTYATHTLYSEFLLSRDQLAYDKIKRYGVKFVSVSQ